MKLVLALAVGASAFGGFGKKSAAPAPARGGGNQVAQGGQTVTNIQVPKIFTTAFGDPGRIAERAARAEAKKAEAEAQLIPTPARFAFAFGRPDILAERRAEPRQDPAVRQRGHGRRRARRHDHHGRCHHDRPIVPVCLLASGNLPIPGFNRLVFLGIPKVKPDQYCPDDEKYQVEEERVVDAEPDHFLKRRPLGRDHPYESE